MGPSENKPGCCVLKGDNVFFCLFAPQLLWGESTPASAICFWLHIPRHHRTNVCHQLVREGEVKLPKLDSSVGKGNSLFNHYLLDFRENSTGIGRVLPVIRRWVAVHGGWVSWSTSGASMSLWSAGDLFKLIENSMHSLWRLEGHTRK